MVSRFRIWGGSLFLVASPLSGCLSSSDDDQDANDTSLQAEGADASAGDEVPQLMPVADPATLDQVVELARAARDLRDVAGIDSASQALFHQVGTSMQVLAGRRQIAGGGGSGTSATPTVPERPEVGDSIAARDGHITADFVFPAAYGTTDLEYRYFVEMMTADGADVRLDGTFGLAFVIPQDLGGAAAAAGQPGAVTGTLDIEYVLLASFEALTVGTCPDGAVGGKGGSLTFDYAITYSGEGLTPQYEAALEQSGQAGGGRLVARFGANCAVIVEGT